MDKSYDVNDKSVLLSCKKLAVCITFHYVEQRLQYLKSVCEGLIDLSPEIHLTIVTNAYDEEKIKKIRSSVNTEKLNLEFLIPTGLGHPYLLAWSHMSVFRDRVKDESFSHFLYIEDDIKVTKENINYWLSARETLKSFDFYPSFFRVELNNKDHQWYSTDVMEKMSLFDCEILEVDDKNCFISIVYPYQGMYFYDRELMKEHLEGPSSNPDFDHPNGGVFSIVPQIREKASLGLTYTKVPQGFRSRNLLPFNKFTNQIEKYSFIHHLPNNYTNNPDHIIGKLKIIKLFIPKSVKTYFQKKNKLLARFVIDRILR